MTFHRATTTVRTVISRAAGAITAQLRRTWRTHRHLLSSNAGYATAIAAIAATLATQTTLTDVLVALLAGALTIHCALRRDLDHA